MIYETITKHAAFTLQIPECAREDAPPDVIILLVYGDADPCCFDNSHSAQNTMIARQRPSVSVYDTEN